MAQPKNQGERRRRPRVKLRGELVAKVQTVVQAPVIDLSEGGMLVEVEESLRPGLRCTVKLALSEEAALRLTARVVRSVLVSLVRASTGERTPRYQIALEFVDMSDEERGALAAYLARRTSDVQAEIATPSKRT